MSMQLCYGWRWKKKISLGQLWQINKTKQKNDSISGGMHQIGTRVKQTEVGVSNLDSFAEFPLKHGFGGWQSFHSTPVFLPKLLFWSVPERYYFQFSLRENAFSDPQMKTGRITEQTERISRLKITTLLFTHAPTSKNKKYEQIASSVPVSHLVWVKATCTVHARYINTNDVLWYFKLR